MPTNRSKDKGKVYERQVAKHLSNVFELPFQRVPNSGAFVGGKNVFRVEQMTEEQKLLADGDIIVPKELSHISFECKWYKQFRWHHLFEKKGEANLNSWIKQVSETTKPYWFILFKINRCGEYVVYPSKIYSLMPTGNQIKYYMLDRDHGYVIQSLTGFFENNKDAILALER